MKQKIFLTAFVTLGAIQPILAQTTDFKKQFDQPGVLLPITLLTIHSQAS